MEDKTKSLKDKLKLQELSFQHFRLIFQHSKKCFKKGA